METQWKEKKLDFGITNSSIWSNLSTATSNGSMNASIESFKPLQIAIMMLNMGMGEVILGGVGTGTITLIAFMILTTFIAGLMIGKAPEFLGKKIENYDIKMVLIILLTTPFCVLVTSAISMLYPETINLIDNSAHGFTQLMYTFISTGANNGSSMTGFIANTTLLNITLIICMLATRFIPMYGALKLSENLSKKKIVFNSNTSLKMYKPVFQIMLIIMIIIIGALTFLPVIFLGPLAHL